MDEFCAARTPRARRRRRLSSSTMRIPCRLVLLLLATAATIGRSDGLDGERFVPSVGAEGTFVDEHPSVPPHLGWSAGLFFNYADDQIVVRDTTGQVASRPLHTGLTADVTASLGLFGWSELGLGLPP